MKNVCIITSHPFWSEPLGCGSLMRSRYELLSQIGADVRVIFLTRSAAQCPLPNSGTLRVAGDFTEEHVDVLRSFVVREKISTCYFSYAIFDQLAARLPCRTVVELHDVLHLRQKSFESFGRQPPVTIDKDEEIRGLANFDAVLCINLDEARYLADCGVAGVSYLPPAMVFSPVPGPGEGLVAGLIGSRALPNADGLQHAFSALRQLPHLVIAGAICEEPVLRETGGPMPDLLGVLPEVRTFYERIHVALSPIRFGGGLKIKVFEALANGKPVIATSHSAEGFPAGIRDIVLVEDDFSKWTVDLVRRAADIRRDDIADYFAEHFSMERCRSILASVL